VGFSQGKEEIEKLEFTQFSGISNLKSFLRALWQNRDDSLSVAIPLLSGKPSYPTIPLEPLQKEQSL